MASKSPLVAVDTNMLLDLALEVEACWDCMDAMKLRRQVPRLAVLPTVLQELAHLTENGPTASARSASLKALQALLSWGF
jgi:rRNA-processing protein FCF1